MVRLVLPVALLVFCHGATAFMPSARVSHRASVLKATARNDEEGRISRRSLLQTALGGALMAPFLSFPNNAEAKAVKRLKNAPLVDVGNGVSYQDMAIGDGKPPKPGDIVAMHYSLYYNGFEVESSRESVGVAATPLGFTWGARPGRGGIWSGVQEGMEGMTVGSRRKITLPSEMAFGKEGKPPFIPPGVKVLFDVSVWSIKPAGVNPNVTLFGQQNYF